MNLDLSAPVKQIQTILNEGLARLPMFIIAVIVFFAFYYFGRLVKNLVHRTFESKGRRQNISLLLGRLSQGLLVFAGLIAALLILFPSVQAESIVQLFGIGSVAIGFAFRDILQNFLAGMLILINEPFSIGDQIKVKDLEGRVTDIQSRATLLAASDGRVIVVPNSTLFTEAVIVAPAGTPAAAISARGPERSPAPAVTPQAVPAGV